MNGNGETRVYKVLKAKKKKDFFNLILALVLIVTIDQRTELIWMRFEWLSESEVTDRFDWLEVTNGWLINGYNEVDDEIKNREIVWKKHLTLMVMCKCDTPLYS